MQQLAGKIAIVTGGASGLGYAMCQSLAASGMKVVIADIEETALAEAVESFADANAEVMPALLDVTNRSQFEDIADEVEARFGKIHVLCNNAGVAVGGHVADMTYKDWDWVMGVNLDGVVNGVVTCINRIKSHGEGGHIVNTASMAGQIGIPNLSVYNTTKFAVVGMSECMRLDLEADGIGVSVLCPGVVQTNIFNSGRNRPTKLQGDVDTASLLLTTDVTDDQRAARVEELMAGGIPPEWVGDMVVDAIRNNDMYIFTHPEFAENLQMRSSAIQQSFSRWQTYRDQMTGS